MKTLIFSLTILISVYQVSNAQQVFIYHENGNKEYLTEVDSLIEIKFHKTLDDETIKQVLSGFDEVNMQTDIIQHRLITKIGTNEISSVERFKRDRNIKYINKSLLNSNDEIQIATDKVMVEIKKGNDLTTILKKLNISYENIQRLGSGENSYLITLQDGKSIETANLLYETGFFDSSQPSFTRFIEMMNEFYSNQWGFNNTGQFGGTPNIDINVPEAWGITFGNPNIRVAVIDQGVDLTHSDLRASLLPGYDATDGGLGGVNGACWGDDAHGTCCAGIITAQNNSIGTIGVAPNCRIIPIRVTYTQTTNNIRREIWNDDWTVNAFNRAWQVSNADVISCSWGGGGNIVLLNTEINNALTQGRGGLGCIVVFSTGNDNEPIIYPANSNPAILAIGAINQCGQRKSPNSCDNIPWFRPRYGDYLGGSNFGTQLDIVAPGVRIYTSDIQGNAGYNPPQEGTDINNRDYTSNFGGTSAATPHVASVAALMLSVRPDLTGQQVRNVIEQTAQKVGGYSYTTTTGRPNGTWHQEMGYGLVNAYAAVYAVAPRIYGNSVVCTQATYNIQNLPAIATVQWSTSNTSIATINTSGVLTKISNGAVEVRATVTINGTQVVLKPLNVWCGAPHITSITGISEGAFYKYGRILNLSVHNQEQGITNYEWDIDCGDILSGQGTSGIVVQLWDNFENENLPFYVSVRCSNACGLGNICIVNAYIIPNPHYLNISISPNPTSGITTVKLVQTSDASKQILYTPVERWTIEVYDTQLRQRWQQTKSNENTAVFNTYGWQPGIYTVIVRLEKDILTGRLVVQ